MRESVLIESFWLYTVDCKPRVAIRIVTQNIFFIMLVKNNQVNIIFKPFRQQKNRITIMIMRLYLSTYDFFMGCILQMKPYKCSHLHQISTGDSQSNPPGNLPSPGKK